MLLGGVVTGLLVLGLFFTMLSSNPRKEDPGCRWPADRRRGPLTAIFCRPLARCDDPLLSV